MMFRFGLGSSRCEEGMLYGADLMSRFLSQNTRKTQFYRSCTGNYSAKSACSFKHGLHSVGPNSVQPIWRCIAVFRSGYYAEQGRFCRAYTMPGRVSSGFSAVYSVQVGGIQQILSQ